MMKSLFLLLALTLSSSLAQNFEYTDCPFALPEGEKLDETISCGFLFVPENRNDPESVEIELAVAILYARQQPARPDAVIYLNGGPGNATLTEIEGWSQSMLRETRDLILFDQRGTGYSFPVLNCVEFDDGNYDSYASEEEASLACLERLKEEGIATDSYNSRENASDVADLVKALRLKEVNLYSISYGTRLALTVMRDHPVGIRSVVLDSAYPPNVEGIAEAPMHLQRAFDQLFSECRADEACNAAYPSLEADFYALLEDLKETPYTLADALELSASDYVDSLFQALYDTWLIPGLPYAISLATQGNLDDSYALLTGELTAEDIAADEQPLSVLWQLLVGVFARQAASIDDDAEGMYNSVECYEDAPFQTPQMVKDLSQGVHPSLRDAQIASALSQLELCEMWSGETAGEIENEAVVSDIPTLVLAGSLDPITPPGWGELAAQSLANSSFILLPGMGHSLIDYYDCPNSLIASFFDHPEQALDSNCTAQMKTSFYIPE